MVKRDEKCKRCGHIWLKRVEKPKQCPKCTSRIWWKEKDDKPIIYKEVETEMKQEDKKDKSVSLD